MREAIEAPSLLSETPRTIIFPTSLLTNLTAVLFLSRTLILLLRILNSLSDSSIALEVGLRTDVAFERGAGCGWHRVQRAVVTMAVFYAREKAEPLPLAYALHQEGYHHRTP
jgi:hypothetical protein